MANIRCMFVGQGASGLAEDRFVNTFHFVNGDPYETHLGQATSKVADFYNGVGTEGPPQTYPLSSWLSPYVSRTAELRFYNLADAKPRVPTVVPLTLAPTTISESIPEEVAVVATLHGLPPVTARRRGRIYLGPLTRTAIASGGTSNPCRPANALILDLVTACKRLADATLFGGGWSIRSTIPSENFVPIVSGYVDNAFDTQRRRGPDPSARSTWIAPGP